MHICHAIASLDPNAGGPPVVVSSLSLAQSRLGHRVTILTHPSPSRVGFAEIPGVSDVLRPQVIQIANYGLWGAIIGNKTVSILRSHLKEVDFLHIHGLWEPLVLRLRSVARQERVAYAVAPHGMLDPWSLGQKRLKKQMALAMGYRRVLNQAAFIHCLNSTEAQLLKPLRLKSPTEIIPNGVFEHEMTSLPHRGIFRAKYPQLANARIVLFLSRLHYKKGLDYLADAFAQVVKSVDNAYMVVAGPDGGDQTRFEAQVRSLRLEAQVLMVGPLYGRAKYEAIVDADCFCLPSRQEGFSMAVLEAMCCATPVVVSTNCHFDEVSEVEAGFIVPLDVTAIAQSLLKVLSDPAAARMMGEAGRRLVSSRFTWERIAAATVSCYSHYAHPPGIALHQLP